MIWSLTECLYRAERVREVTSSWTRSPLQVALLDPLPAGVPFSDLPPDRVPSYRKMSLLYVWDRYFDLPGDRVERVMIDWNYDSVSKTLVYRFRQR